MQTDQIDFQQVIAVTNRHLCVRSFAEQIDRVCRLHPRAIVLRESDLPPEDYACMVSETLFFCQEYAVDCIVHTYVDIARRYKVDKIHLPLEKLREYGKDGLKDFHVIGVSVRSVEEALEAQELGATYLAAGSVYRSDMRTNLKSLGTDFLKEVCDAVEIPVYGIGGIKLDPSQIQEVLEQGAVGACIMSGIMEL